MLEIAISRPSSTLLLGLLLFSCRCFLPSITNTLSHMMLCLADYLATIERFAYLDRDANEATDLVYPSRTKRKDHVNT